MSDMGQALAKLAQRVAALEADPHVVAAADESKKIFADAVAAVSGRVDALEAKPSLEPFIQTAHDAIRALQIGVKAAVEKLEEHGATIEAHSSAVQNLSERTLSTEAVVSNHDTRVDALEQITKAPDPPPPPSSDPPIEEKPVDPEK